MLRFDLVYDTPIYGVKFACWYLGDHVVPFQVKVLNPDESRQPCSFPSKANLCCWKYFHEVRGATHSKYHVAQLSW